MSTLETEKKELKAVIEQKTKLKVQLDEYMLAINEAKIELEGIQTATKEAERLTVIAKDTQKVEENQKSYLLGELDGMKLAKIALVAQIEELQTKISLNDNVIAEFEAQMNARENKERARVSELIENETLDARNELESIRQSIFIGNDTKAHLEKTNFNLKEENINIARINRELGYAYAEEIEKMQNLVPEVREFEAREVGLKQSVTSLSQLKETLISENQSIQDKLTLINESVEAKLKEVSVINAQIEAKNAEFAVAIRRLFAISQRETAVDQREAFIKAQYEKAGIKYQ
jgi:hypothetical protein